MAGRVPFSQKIMTFDRRAYQRDLEDVLMAATQELQRTLYQKVRDRASGLPFKDNPVRLANGQVTSDAERRLDLLNSIQTSAPRWLQRHRIQASVSAMEGNFKESHIGWYYEYGTGEKADRSHEPKLGRGSWNRFRSGGVPTAGARIVTRSIRYNRGEWIDMGGNRRITYSYQGGETDEGFRAYIGEDVKPYYWFGKSVQEVRQEMPQVYRKALAEVPLTRYLHMPSTYRLG